LKPSTASWKWSYPKFPLVAAFGGALKHRYERLPDRRVQVSAGGPRRRIETGERGVRPFIVGRFPPGVLGGALKPVS
jgi:hypothetical protein